ncbi:Gag polyprotein, partial [Dissostichus eleginoides]
MEAFGVAEEWASEPASTQSKARRFNQQWSPNRAKPVQMNSREVICHNCSGVGHIQRNCPSSRKRKQHAPNNTPAPDSGTVVTCNKGSDDDMSIRILIQGHELCALLDSGARRNVLPLRHFNAIPVESRPQIQPSIVQVLQGIGPEGIAVRGEVNLPVQAGSKSHAHLDYGRREITLFGERVPRSKPSRQPEVHLVRVSRTTILESGCEYVVPGTARLRSAVNKDMMLTPTKGFIERQHVLAARVVVQARHSSNIPMRIYNPGPASVTLKRGVVVGVLQPAEVLGEVDLHPTKSPVTSDPNDFPVISVPSHLQDMYAESCAHLFEEDRAGLAHNVNKRRFFPRHPNAPFSSFFPSKCLGSWLPADNEPSQKPPVCIRNYGFGAEIP